MRNNLAHSSHPAAPLPVHATRPDRPAGVSRRGLAVALATFATFAGPAWAQDCRLGLRVSPLVANPGVTTRANVFAIFPTTGFAFGESRFDVLASHSAWTYASSGLMTGPYVTGAGFSQTHLPLLDPADPANPLRVWTGEFTPASYEPAFVEIHVLPSMFSYYPSAETPYSVPCEARPGRAWFFVNPLTLGDFAAAPGAGTELETGPEGFLATAGDGPIVVGMLLPAVQKVRAAADRLRFEPEPTSLTARTQTQAAGDDEIPTETISLNFDKLAIPDPAGEEGYALRAIDLPPGTPVEVELSRNKRRVLAFVGEAGRVLLKLSRLPDRLSAQVEPVRAGVTKTGTGRLLLANHNWYGNFQGGVRVAVGDIDGDGAPDVVDATSFRISASFPLPRATTRNNLKQLGIASHSFIVEGASVFAFTPVSE